MKWNKFEESKLEHPEVIVKNAIEGFDTATENYASLLLQEANPTYTNLSCDFQYVLRLTSEDVPSYRHNILYFGYDIALTPIEVIIEDSIDSEIFNSASNRSYRRRNINTENEFSRILENIFQSAQLKKVVGGLIKIAKKERGKSHKF